MARWLGIDYGEKRVGIAISDPMEVVSTPLETIDNTSRDRCVARIAELVRDREIGGIVVGLPLHMNGTEGERVHRTQAFVLSLKGSVSVPIEWWDERMTTAAVNRMLIQAGTRRERRKEVVDKLAAQQILQAFLEARAGGITPYPEMP